MESTSFVESFVEAFHEDLGIIFSLLMFANLQTAFAMFLLCYAQRLGYLLFIVFPFPSILYHYAKFSTRTIATLQKLFGVGSFYGLIGHLAHR